MKVMKQLTKIIALLVAATVLSGCMDWWPEFGIPAGTEPWGEMNPIQGMHASPAFKDQEADSMTYPPVGSVPTSFRPYPFVRDDLQKAEALKNPVPVTDDSLRYGKMAYQTNCYVCHGETGKGDGPVGRTQAAISATDLTSPAIREHTDGELFHVITKGKGSMWSYKSQLKPTERWAVVNYVRALQRAEFPEPQDLERMTE